MHRLAFDVPSLLSSFTASRRGGAKFAAALSSRAALVLLEHHVQYPGLGVLDAPMARTALANHLAFGPRLLMLESTWVDSRPQGFVTAITQLMLRRSRQVAPSLKASGTLTHPAYYGFQGPPKKMM